LSPSDPSPAGTAADWTGRAAPTATSTQAARETTDRASTRLDGADATQLRAEDDLFERLGIDSFQAVELISDLEDKFDVELPDYELQGIKTFAALAAKIDARR